MRSERCGISLVQSLSLSPLSLAFALLSDIGVTAPSFSMQQNFRKAKVPMPDKMAAI